MIGSYRIKFGVNCSHDDTGLGSHTWPHCGKNGGSCNE